MILNVLTAPDPRLRLKAQAVEKVDGPIRQLLDSMIETMYEKNGIGLAAIQVGVQKRVVVIDLGEKEGIPFKPLFMVNPELKRTSLETQVITDGCLSVPNQYAEVMRSFEVQVSYLDENNQQQLLTAHGLLAFCIQHEIDHLNGILFIEHLSSLKRKLILSKVLKEKQRKG